MESTVSTDAELQDVALELIDPDPNQPRSGALVVADLVESMKATGLLHPITLRPHPDDGGRFMVVIGHRRRQAALDLGWATIPAFLRPEYADWRRRLVAQADENERRSNLSLLDRCSFYLRTFEQSGIESARRFAQEIRMDPGDLSQILHAAKATGSLRQLLDEGFLTNLAHYKLAKKLPDDRLKRLLVGCRRTKAPLSQRAIDLALTGPANDDEPPSRPPDAALVLPHGDRLRPTLCRALVGVRNLLTPDVLASLLPAEQIDLLLEFLGELEQTSLAA